MTPQQPSRKLSERAALALACFLILGTYWLLIDLKGINSDEGLRLAIMNGGEPYSLNDPTPHATWRQVLATNSYCAYQPLYFLIQNTLMRIARTHDAVFLKAVNIFFLWTALQGLLSLARDWRLVPRLFLLGVFSLNAYLLMHVLQIREYILSVSFYIWSTWLVLRLDARKLERIGLDAAWFAGYGILLTLGFYVQSWAVFPALAQGLFLVFRRSPGRWRFYAHLVLTYLIVLSATLPYLLTHKQKVDIGRWGTEGTALWPQLSNGLHLVLAGHIAGHSRFTDFLCCFWLVAIAGGALVFFLGKTPVPSAPEPRVVKRQGVLMLLSIVVPLAFQLGYFFKLDNLSVWPRYFVIHYFFLFWLVALAFNHLWLLRAAPGLATWRRHATTTAVAVLLGVMGASGVYQTRSYYLDPFLDTGLSPKVNWTVWANELARHVEPDDVIFMYDFTSRATLTFSRPMANRILTLPELETTDLKSVSRVTYLESYYVTSQRHELAGRMAALGFKSMRITPMYYADRQTMITEWSVLSFTRE